MWYGHQKNFSPAPSSETACILQVTPPQCRSMHTTSTPFVLFTHVTKHKQHPALPYIRHITKSNWEESYTAKQCDLEEGANVIAHREGIQWKQNGCFQTELLMWKRKDGSMASQQTWEPQSSTKKCRGSGQERFRSRWPTGSMCSLFPVAKLVPCSPLCSTRNPDLVPLRQQFSCFSFPFHQRTDCMPSLQFNVHICRIADYWQWLHEGTRWLKMQWLSH